MALVIVIGISIPLRPSTTDLARMYEMAGRATESVQFFEKQLAEYPDDTEALRALAPLYRYLGRTTDAITQLRKLKQLVPEDAEVREELIRAYYDSMQMEPLIEEREGLVALLEDRAVHPEVRAKLLEQYRQLISLYMFYDRENDALGIYRRMRVLVPTNLEVMRNYVGLVLRLRPENDLASVVTTVVDQFPQEADLAESAVAIALSLKDYAQAEAAAKVFIQYHPEDWTLWAYLMTTQQTEAEHDPGKLPEYLTTVIQAYQHFGKEVPLDDIISRVLEQGHLADAKSAIEQWREASPTSPEPYRLLLYVYAPHAKSSPREMAGFMREALANFPNDREFLKDAAWQAFDHDEWRLAVEYWKRLIALEPREYIYRESLLVSLDRVDDAVEFDAAAEQALADFPDHQELNAVLAAHLQNRSQWRAAATEWGRLRARDPKNKDYFENYLFSLQQGGDDAALEKLMAENPDKKEVQILIGYRLLDQRRFGEALPIWERLWNAEPLSSEYLASYVYCLESLNLFAQLHTVEEQIRPQFAEDDDQLEALN